MMERYEDIRERDALYCVVRINDGIFAMVSDNVGFDEIEEIAREPLG